MKILKPSDFEEGFYGLNGRYGFYGGESEGNNLVMKGPDNKKMNIGAHYETLPHYDFVSLSSAEGWANGLRKKAKELEQLAQWVDETLKEHTDKTPEGKASHKNEEDPKASRGAVPLMKCRT